MDSWKAPCWHFNLLGSQRTADAAVFHLKINTWREEAAKLQPLPTRWSEESCYGVPTDALNQACLGFKANLKQYITTLNNMPLLDDCQRNQIKHICCWKTIHTDDKPWFLVLFSLFASIYHDVSARSIYTTCSLYCLIPINTLQQLN